MSVLLQATHFNTYYHTVDCYVLSAQCYYRMGQYERAVQDCDSVLQTAFDNIKANKIKMLSCEAMADFEEAIKCAELIISLKDKSKYQRYYASFSKGGAADEGDAVDTMVSKHLLRLQQK